MKTCSLCGKKFKGWGNNSSPFQRGDCCDDCNNRLVLPLRMFLLGGTNYFMTIRVDNSIFVDQPKGEVLSLEEIQAQVDGYFEIYPTENEKFFFLVNEEGLIRNMEPNFLAHEIFELYVRGNLMIVPKHLLE